jgi:hypothetical protein
MNNETVSEIEANNEILNSVLTDEQIMAQKEMMRALYESMRRGKHYNQRRTKGAFGSAKNKYKPQTNR